MNGTEFLTSIENTIENEFDWDVKAHETNITIYTGFSGLQITIEVVNDSPKIYFYERTTSWQYDGERSDLHDVISTLLSVFLKLNFDISCALYDVPHPAIETSCEIYARYIIPQQLNSWFNELNENARNKVIELLVGVHAFEMIFWRMVGCPCEDCRKELNPPYEYSYEFDDNWDQTVQVSLGSKSKQLSLSSRYLPTWNYYKNYSSHISVVKSSMLCTFLKLQSKEKLKSVKTISGLNGDLLITDNCSNFTSQKIKKKIYSILKTLDNLEEKNIPIIQLENISVAIGSEHLLFIESLGGLYKFNEEKELVRQRQISENEWLFKPTNLTWAKNIDGGKFEELIKDLLEREPDVTWIRKVSHTNEQDGGRDLIAEWRTSPLPDEKLEESKNPYKTRRIIVQCKTSNKGIGKSEVNDIRDTIEHFGYDGYFLAVSSYTKRNLTDALDKLKIGGKFWINWWTRDEIEKRLVIHKDLIAKYPTILTVI
jgi:hypothetical protein